MATDVTLYTHTAAKTSNSIESRSGLDHTNPSELISKGTLDSVSFTWPEGMLERLSRKAPYNDQIL